MKGILLETDILVDYLTAPAGTSTIFRWLLASTVCYSTFIQAAEIYSATRDADDRRVVDRALFGLKVLGANSRYAKTIGDLLSSVSTASAEDEAPGTTLSGYGLRIATVAAMAIESNLPVVTRAWGRVYSSIPQLRLIEAEELKGVTEPGAIMEILDRWR